MAVTSQLADRLLPYAVGPAIDVLFNDSDQCNITAENQPSPGVVLKRWSTLTAASAIHLARNIKDVDLLDTLAAKEKRKTVRVALAGNAHVHPITRLYFLQEGLRANDWDLVSNALKLMDPDMLVGLSQCSDMNHRLRSRDIAEALLKCQDRDVAVAALRNADNLRDRNTVIANMLGRSTDLALDILDAAEIKLDSLDFSSFEGSADASSASLRRLLEASSGVDRFRYRSGFVSAYSGQLDKIEAVDPSLLSDAVNELRTVDENVVAIYARNGLTGALIKSLRFSVTITEQAAELLAVSLTSDEERASLAFSHPQPALAARLLTDTTIFVEKARSEGPLNYQRWLLKLVPFISIEKFFEMLAVQDKPDLTGQWVNRFASTLEMPIGKFVDLIPDALLHHLSGLPDIDDANFYDTLLRRACAHSVDAEVAVCTLILKNRYSQESIQTEAARLLIERGQVDVMGEWLHSASLECVQALLPENMDFIVKSYLEISRGNRWRLSWTGLIVESLTPESGWGSMQSNALEGAMKFLNARIGDDAIVWGTVLNLFEGWTGTLDDLVTAARTL